LQLRPGTDDALALSMLHVIIGEDLIDREFVERWTHGFDKLAAHVAPFSPEWAEPITWVPAGKIRDAARLFAETRPAAVEWGCAIEHTPNSIQTVRAISMLPAITGNIDVPGGWVFGSHGFGKFPFLREHLSEEAKSKRLGADQFKVLGEANVVPSAHIPAVFKAMRTGEPYPVKAFLVFGNNSLATYANSKVVHESLKKVEFFSVMDLYMTPSAEWADLVLPAASWLELDCATGFPFFAETTALPQQKIVQIGESKQDEVVFMELARKMNLAVGQEDIEEIFDAQMAENFGMTFAELKEKGYAHKPITYRKHESNGKGFDTETGKIELYSLALEKLGYAPLPFYVEPPESPVSDPETAKEFPYVLTSGARVANYFTSEFRQIPKLRFSHPDPLVELHPDTAGKLSIEDGEWIWIETKRGKIKQKAKITDGIDPKVINIEFGWWFPERKDGEYGIWESNANVLTNIEPPYDPSIGTYQLRALLCKVYKES
ncbi:MAG: molybdopterin-dependent oxidoreductase, partial [bacterium]|nr:molybdopterin-dependent oxidoreductase [bacterium]